ncbi:hypothetical protein AAU61_05645 [Desulfocarbo indianensis]|nr:hypothetical protein AAU61_05645 [Desulfocarbo indianensis]
MQGRNNGLLVGIIFYLLAWGWLGAGPAPAAGPSQEPWSLAFVVEDSSAMAEPWLGSYRREAVEKALNLELRTLPLRISAGVWLARAGKAERLVPPASALELKDLELKLPAPLAGPPELGPAVAAACAWLQSRGGGSLIIIAAGGREPLAAWAARLDSADIFCHALALAPGAGGASLAELALAGGGSWFLAEKPERVLTLLHRAVLTCLSAGRLLIETHDPANRPVQISFGLERQDALARKRQGFSGRVQQCLPGVYALAWPPAAATGPAPVPPRVSVAPEGVTRLPVGGRAKLKVAVLDADGREPGWNMRVSRLSDGKVLEASRRSPFALDLFAGLYLVKSLHLPLAWTVVLEAGRDRELLAGPAGVLKVKMAGPQGPLRARYELWDVLAQRPGGTGYTNQSLRIKPGPYRLRLEVPPGLEREARVPPAGEVKLELPAAGGILLAHGAAGDRVELLDGKGRVLDTGLLNRVMPLLPGAYWARLAGSGQKGRLVNVEAGKLTTIQAADLR